jgi:hypothetical protein
VAAALCNSLADLGLCELDGIAFVLLSQCQPFVQLLLELAIANLLQYVRVPSLVDFECLTAVRADDLVHV